MSKIEDMIRDLCPEGVKRVKIGDHFTRVKGTPITAGTMKEIACEDGDIKIFAGGKTIVNAFEKDIPNANIIRVPAVLVQSRGVIGFVYYDKPFTFKNEMWAYTHSEATTLKYLYYYCTNDIEHFRDAAAGMGSLPQISLPVTQNYEIPLPPLPIQEKIVEILDKFSLLSAELEAELEGRRKQYDFYRNRLLSFDSGSDSVQWKPLSEVGEFIRGRRFVRTDIVEDGQPCIHYGDMYTYYGLEAAETRTHLPEDFPVKLRYAEKGDVVIVAAGENDWDIGVGLAWMGERPVAVHDACFIFKSEMNPKYVAHYLRTEKYHTEIRKYVSSAKICAINSDGLGKAMFPVRPLAEQERIVRFLDKFESLVTDLSAGLPAEIERVQKQYEYYRNKLLTF